MADPLTLTAGIDLGAGNAIRVDRSMATSVVNIWAAGDCVQTWHRILGRFVYMPLGTTAHKQGRLAGENMPGGKTQFQGSLGTQVVAEASRAAPSPSDPGPPPAGTTTTCPLWRRMST